MSTIRWSRSEQSELSLAMGTKEDSYQTEEAICRPYTSMNKITFLSERCGSYRYQLIDNGSRNYILTYFR